MLLLFSLRFALLLEGALTNCFKYFLFCLVVEADWTALGEDVVVKTDVVLVVVAVVVVVVVEGGLVGKASDAKSGLLSGRWDQVVVSVGTSEVVVIVV